MGGHEGTDTLESLEEAYATLDEQQKALAKVEAEADNFRELEELFELQISKYAKLREARHDIILLKMVWDTRAVVQSFFSTWQETLWAEIEVDELNALYALLTL